MIRWSCSYCVFCTRQQLRCTICSGHTSKHHSGCEILPSRLTIAFVVVCILDVFQLRSAKKNIISPPGSIMYFLLNNVLFCSYVKETQVCWLRCTDQLRSKSARKSMTGQRWRCWYSPKWDCQVRDYPKKHATLFDFFTVMQLQKVIPIQCKSFCVGDHLFFNSLALYRFINKVLLSSIGGFTFTTMCYKVMHMTCRTLHLI